MGSLSAMSRRSEALHDSSFHRGPRTSSPMDGAAAVLVQLLGGIPALVPSANTAQDDYRLIRISELCGRIAGFIDVEEVHPPRCGAPRSRHSPRWATR